MDPKAPFHIDYQNLSVEQLQDVARSMEKDLLIFQDSLAALKLAQEKFQSSADALEKFTPESEEKSIFVPLTGSMYVPGTLVRAKTVIINIGTRYFVEKDIESARDYFKRKIAYVTEQIEKIHILGLERTKVRNSLLEMAQAKVMMMHSMEARKTAAK